MANNEITKDKIENALSTYFEYRENGINYNDRSSSWDLCHKAFNINKNIEELGVVLGFYLSSWGMFRDKRIKSSGIKKFNNVAEFIQEKKNKDNFLKGLNEKIEEQFEYSTTTLLTKIILGTTSELPAIDEYFRITSRKIGIFFPHEYDEDIIPNYEKILENKINSETIKDILENWQKNNEHCKELPLAKLLDAAFWQISSIK